MTQLFTGARFPHRARYLYAGQDGTGRIPLTQSSALPAGRKPSWLGDTGDLDFLDSGNPFFYTDRALFSVGPFIGGSVPRTMFAKAKGRTILGDSGGFQFIDRPTLFQGDATREWVLATLEHEADEAITLDIPTAAIGNDPRWPDFNGALAMSQDSLRFFDRHRAGRTRFLNVLQGRNRREALRWFDAVKWFPSGGWAFGGDMRRNWSHLVFMLRRLAAEKLLGRGRNRVHVLGVGDLTGGVLLSAIQRGMQEWLGDTSFLITFDASSPSYLGGKRKAYSLPGFSADSFTLETWSPPTVVREGRGDTPWPFAQTAIGARIKMGDLCREKHGLARTAWDSLSEALIVHHNVNALLLALDAANAIMELHPDDARGLAPPSLIGAYNALRLACLAAEPEAYLRPSTGQLVELVKAEPESGPYRV
jgi:hypothetical protein